MVAYLGVSALIFALACPTQNYFCFCCRSCSPDAVSVPRTHGRQPARHPDHPAARRHRPGRRGFFGQWSSMTAGWRSSSSTWRTSRSARISPSRTTTKWNTVNSADGAVILKVVARDFSGNQSCHLQERHGRSTALTRGAPKLTPSPQGGTFIGLAGERAGLSDGCGVFPHIFFHPTMTMPPDLARMVRDEVDRLGFELVDVRVGGPPHRRHLAVRIDRPGSRPGAGVTSEDCTSVTRALQAWFPTARPGEVLEGIEVSSPGIERPLRCGSSTGGASSDPGFGSEPPGYQGERIGVITSVVG